MKKKGTRYFSAVMVFLLVMTCLAPTFATKTYASEGDTGTDGDYNWVELADGSVEITQYSGSGGAVVIPDTLSGKTVSQIGSFVFSGSDLTSVVIPDSITSLGYQIFAGSSELKSVTLGEGITNIPGEAFMNCIKLESVVLPESLLTISFGAFTNCGLLSSVEFPNQLQSIGQGCFTDCVALSSVVLPESMLGIGPDSFSYCGALQSVTVLSSTMTFGEEDSPAVFTNSPLTEGIYGFDESTAEAYATTYDIPFSQICKVSFDSKGGSSVEDAIVNVGDFVNEPDTPTYAGNILDGWYQEDTMETLWDFGCNAVTSNITLYAKWIPVVTEGDYQYFALDEDNVCIGKYLGNDAQVTIPDTLGGKTVTQIYKNAFSKNEAIESVTMPNTIDTIGAGAFQNCANLQTVTLSTGLETMGSGVFKETGITSIVIPNGVTNLESDMFFGCTSLASVTLSQTLNSLGGSSFMGCTQLLAITIPDNVSEIQYGTFSGCTKLADVTLGSGIISIDGDAFLNCPALETIVIPEGVKYINFGAFKNCTGLTQITLPDSLLSMGEQSFAGCTSLGYVSFPKNLVGIGPYSFKGCTSLDKVVVWNSSMTFGEGVAEVFSETSLEDGIYGYDGSTAETYATAYSIPFHQFYTVSFNSNGGTGIDSVLTEDGSKITKPTNPTKSGYVFCGWYKETGLTNAWNFAADTVSTDKTLYAKWLGTPMLSSVTVASPTSIKVTWSAVSGAAGYKVYRSTSSTSNFAAVKTITSGSTINWTDTGLSPGTTYYYKVCATGVDGATAVNSNASAVKSAKPVLGTPTAKSASASYTSIKTTWGAVSGAAGYELYRAISKTGTYTKVYSGTALSYTNTGRTTGKTYYYKVKAYVMAGSTKVYGSYSAIVYAKAVPGTPTAKATRVSNSSVKVTWSAVTGTTKYQVYRATSKTGTYSLLTTTTSRSYTNKALKNNKTYYYKVRAYHLEGSTKVYGSFSSIKSATP